MYRKGGIIYREKPFELKLHHIVRPKSHTGHKKKYKEVQVRNFYWKIVPN